VLLARKRFGQHFLEAAWADKLVAAIEPHPGDQFLEIGPGPGALTLRLAPLVAHVTAIEIDRDLIAALAPKLPANVSLRQADVLSVDLATVMPSGPVRVAGNLPYNIASPILFRLLEEYRRTRSPADGAAVRGGTLIDATLMVQREVADRITAGPGFRDYGALSIGVQTYADVRRVLTLPPGAFRPPPKVHSAVVRLTFRPPRERILDERVFDRMVRSIFTQRRKTLANALASFASTRGTDPRAALADAGIDPRRRAETLDLAELARLAKAFGDAAQ
jgi:16S rRNA (adenine1518-N6/adenine1519-N6)-dimethyltransferase